MIYSQKVIAALLKKYEKSGHFHSSSNRRFILKDEVEIPAADSLDYPDFVEEMRGFESNGLINIDWIKKNCVINRISLELANLDNAYKFANMPDKRAEINKVSAAISRSLTKITGGWIAEYLNNEHEKLISKGSLCGGLRKEEFSIIADALKALELIYSLDGGEISARAASVRLYSDSKRFERSIKKYIVSVIRKNEPVFAEIDDTEIDDRTVLAQVGIILMPEVYPNTRCFMMLSTQFPKAELRLNRRVF